MSTLGDVEIDTLLHPEGKTKGELDPAALPYLSLAAEAKAAANTSSDPLEKTFTFPDFVNIGYGELVRVTLRLVQIGEGRGLGYLTFTQQMRCRRSDVVDGPDLWFSVELRDQHDAFIRHVSLGAWDRRCGTQFVELKEAFDWVLGSINPVQFAARAGLTCSHKVRVHNCG